MIDKIKENTKKALKKITKELTKKAVKKAIASLIAFFGGFYLLLIIVIIIIIMFVYGSIEENKYKDCDYTDIKTENIEFLIPTIEEEMKNNDIDISYKPAILSQLHQESGDIEEVLHSDPFQSSESLCGSRGCITDPKQSVSQAMKIHKQNYLKYQNLNLSGSVEDTLLQAYNFGSGFLDFLKSEDEEYSEDEAYKFSEKMTKEHPEYLTGCLDPKHKACYGDYKYVKHVHMKGGYVCDQIEGELTTLPEETNTYKVTQGYGHVDDPYTKDGWHDGIDIAGVDGAMIYAAGDGEVVFSGVEPLGANVVIIKHSDNLFTTYAHLKEPSDLKVGDNVVAGDVIGHQGSTGQSSGSHLHFEVRHENSFNVGPEYTDNPENYLPIEENQMK